MHTSGSLHTRGAHAQTSSPGRGRRSRIILKRRCGVVCGNEASRARPAGRGSADQAPCQPIYCTMECRFMTEQDPPFRTASPLLLLPAPFGRTVVAQSRLNSIMQANSYAMRAYCIARGSQRKRNHQVRCQTRLRHTSSYWSIFISCFMSDFLAAWPTSQQNLPQFPFAQSPLQASWTVPPFCNAPQSLLVAHS